MASQGTDGVFTDLVPLLLQQFNGDAVRLDHRALGKRISLLVRTGAKRAFYIRIVRRNARHLIEMGGGDPVRVLRTVRLCRDHFDRWFGLTPRDIKTYERASRTPHGN